MTFCNPSSEPRTHSQTGESELVTHETRERSSFYKPPPTPFKMGFRAGMRRRRPFSAPPTRN